MSKKVISLFSGCGGMDLGFEGGFEVLKTSIDNLDIKTSPGSKSYFATLPKTSFEHVFACDIKPDAKIIWGNYFSHEGVFHQESIVDIVKKVKKGETRFPKADIVTGGFPCQDFSVAGKRLGLKSKKTHMSTKDISSPSIENRGMLYYWMREAISIISPNIFIAENVKGLVSLGDVKDIITNDFRNINGGYVVLEPLVLKAADFGVPQSRERIIFIGIKKDALLDGALEKIKSGDEKYNPYPTPTHDIKNGSFVSVKKAFQGLKEPHLSNDEEQKNYSKAKWYGKHCQGQIEVNLSKVAPTIRAEHHGNIEFRRLSKENGGTIKNEYHLSQRRLTIRECARIQTFPDDFKFIIPKVVSTSKAYKLIGNAVPPLLAYHIARRIEEVWPLYFND